MLLEMSGQVERLPERRCFGQQVACDDPSSPLLDGPLKGPYELFGRQRVYADGTMATAVLLDRRGSLARLGEEYYHEAGHKNPEGIDVVPSYSAITGDSAQTWLRYARPPNRPRRGYQDRTLRHTTTFPSQTPHAIRNSHHHQKQPHFAWLSLTPRIVTIQV